MARKAAPKPPEVIRQDLIDLLSAFEDEIPKVDLRPKIIALVPVHKGVRKLGSMLLPKDAGKAARDRVLYYFLRYPQVVIPGGELMVVSGIGEWARRLRELRVQYGWRILSGKTAKEMQKEEDEVVPGIDMGKMKPDEYILVDSTQDTEAAGRWKRANTIRRGTGSIRDKILRFLIENVGKKISGEELRYLANNKTEWARRARELRTDFGWLVMTKTTGMPELPVGIYVLASDRQAPEHDRKIPDAVRRSSLRRDKYRCQDCGWNQSEWNPSDARHLEAHHIKEHAKGGDNSLENLITLCNVCHDKIHSSVGANSPVLAGK